MRKRNPALASNAAFHKVKAGDSKKVYAYTREAAGQKVLVVLNMSSQPQTITITDKPLQGQPHNVFTGAEEWVDGKPWQLEPWGYKVYEYKAQTSTNYTKNAH